MTQGAPNSRTLPPSRQGSFFVGGRTVRSTALSAVPAYTASGEIVVDQVYVHYQLPRDVASKVPLVLVHGSCLTGKTWETTPDGRMGWDEYFLCDGHPVYVVDQAWRGRSAIDPSAVNAVRLGEEPTRSLPPIYSVGQDLTWERFRFGPKPPERFPGVLFPFDALDEFGKQMVPDWTLAAPSPNPTIAGLAELAERIDGTVLIAHSQAGIYPFLAAAAERGGIAAIVAIEPATCPACGDDLSALLDIPILFLWGDYVDASPRWAPRLAADRELVRVLNAAGGNAEVVVLPEIGITHNSHLPMLDLNSLDIAAWLGGWIAGHVAARH